MALACFVAPWGRLQAQTGATGEIHGRVEDKEAHTPVSATVTASLPDGSYRRQVTGRADGSFTIALLPPGTYQLEVHRLGYQPVLVKAVAVTADHVSQLTVLLTHTATTLAAVVVEAPQVTIKRGDTQFETEVNADAIASLPIGLDIDRAIALTPGARPNQMWGGATAQANNYQIDGVSMNHPGVGGRAFEPNVSWVQQLEVRGLGAGAEYGDFQGGLVDMITKSGSNTEEGFARANFQSSLLNSSGLTSTVIVPEVESRYEGEAESRGAIVHDRLFYYVSGQVLNTSSRAVNHLQVPDQPGPFYSPVQEGSIEHKVLGKLTWAPSATDLFNVSLGHLGTMTEHYALSGRETPLATSRYKSPLVMYEASWDHQFAHAGALRLSMAGSGGRQHVDPYAAVSTPGIATFQLSTSRGYQNAPFTEEMAPTTNGAKLTWKVGATTGSVKHRFTVGGDASVGTWADDRTRNGGMTWRPRYYSPVDRTFNPADALTWDPHIPFDVGGDVHLHTRSTNSAAFIEDELTAGRITFTPGLRAGAWTGQISDPQPNQFSGVRTSGLDPRVGLVIDLSHERGPAPTFQFKAHWGRYHQSMFAEMFDRAAGSQAYTDQNLWEYEGPLFSNPSTTFTAAQRDSLQNAGALKLLEHADLSETGQITNYRQPYVDQFVTGVEKTLAGRIKMEALYVRRDNHNAVALVDKNVANDWVEFNNVGLVTNGAAALGQPTPLRDQNGNLLSLPVLYVPTWAILQDLRDLAAAKKIDPAEGNPLVIPGYTLADTARLSWNPDYQLTNVPQAQRHFQQAQLNTTITGASWDATLSVAWTDVRGNYASVTGYDDYTIYGRDQVVGRGPGPYVRPNEAINYNGRLENFSPLEVKLRGSTALPWRFRAGAVITGTTGDPLTPYVAITPYGINFNVQGSSQQPLPQELLAAIAGQRIYTATRGSYGYRPRADADLHVERDIGDLRRPWTIALDVFNVANDRSIALKNAALEAQVDATYPVPYASPLQLVDPRRIRLGAEYHF